MNIIAGTDEESILTLLTSRSNAQRQEIAVAFKTLFGRDLLDDLKSELTGKFEKLIVALMKPSRLYDAYELKHALKGSGTDEKVLTEIIASRTPEELRAIKQVYEEGKCFELYFPSFLLSLFHFSKVNAVL